MVRLLYAFLFRIAADPTESQDVGVKKIILAGVHLAIIPLILAYLFLSYFLQEFNVVWIGVGQIIWHLVFVFVFPRLHMNIQWLANAAGAGLLIFFLSYTFASGGFENSGYLLPLFGLANPLVALINLRARQSLFWLFMHITSILVVSFLQPYLPSHNLPSTVVSILLSVNSIIAAVMYFCIFIYFINQRDEAFRLLHNEQAKSEKLLLNILPKDIAARLKGGEDTIADSYESASIMFIDLVNFTPLSATSPPKEMVILLSKIFSHFDQLVEEHHVEKIDTIGDGYMVAAGLPVPREDHAEAIASLALEIRSYFKKGISLSGHSINCRIGINSGPLMAGVIGRTKFSYNVWGDTVNTASRMESHSIPGEIQISEATYALIKERFNCEARGPIDVKGKGIMHTYLLKNKME